MPSDVLAMMVVCGPCSLLNIMVPTVAVFVTTLCIKAAGCWLTTMQFDGATTLALLWHIVDVHAFHSSAVLSERSVVAAAASFGVSVPQEFLLVPSHTRGRERAGRPQVLVPAHARLRLQLVEAIHDPEPAATCHSRSSSQSELRLSLHLQTDPASVGPSATHKLEMKSLTFQLLQRKCVHVPVCFCRCHPQLLFLLPDKSHST